MTVRTAMIDGRSSVLGRPDGRVDRGEVGAVLDLLDMPAVGREPRERRPR